jgi:Family of unknown function (DUF6328)
MQLDRKLKTALDESRLLILGAQVLFGFQFQSVFQEGFSHLSATAKSVQCAGLLLMLLTIGLLIAPSMYHRLVHRGESRLDALNVATWFAGVSLFPLTLGLAASAFVVFGHVFGRDAGIIAGGVFGLAGLSLLYGFGFVMRIKRRDIPMPGKPEETPLTTKIEQMLTEARVIIPGGQALLGFQFVITLSQSFSDLPYIAKYVHALGLCAVALAVILLMTPAALHRIAFAGEDDPTFLRIGSALVIAATFPLAVGIAAEIYVVFLKISDREGIAIVAAMLSLLVLLGLWFAYPIWRRMTSPADP